MEKMKELDFVLNVVLYNNTLNLIHINSGGAHSYMEHAINRYRN